jgi:hypothetical protein
MKTTFAIAVAGLVATLVAGAVAHPVVGVCVFVATAWIVIARTAPAIVP